MQGKGAWRRISLHNGFRTCVLSQVEDSMIGFSMKWACVLRGTKADLASEFPQLFFQQRSVAEQAMRFLPPKRLDVVGSFLYFGQNRL